MATTNTRIPALYANKQKTVDWLNIIPKMTDLIRPGAEQVRKSYDFENEAGEQLNVVGALVKALRGQATDEEYILIIKSAISRNNGEATIDDILEALSYIVVSPVEFAVLDYEDMSFEIDVVGTLTPTEEQLISQLIPKPQGVRLRGVIQTGNLTPVGPLSSACGNVATRCAGTMQLP